MLLKFGILLFCIIVIQKCSSDLESVWKTVGSYVNITCPFSAEENPDEAALIVLFKGKQRKHTIFSYDARSTLLSSGVSWYHPSLLNRSSLKLTSNAGIIKITDLRRSDQGRYQCRVDYKKSSPTMSAININVPEIKSVLIENNRPLPSGERAELTCKAIGLDRLAEISWWNNHIRLHKVSKSVLDSDNVTRSHISLPVNSEDHRTTVTCQASHPMLPNTIVKDVITLHILGPPSILLPATNLPNVPEDCYAWASKNNVSVRCTPTFQTGSTLKYNMEVVDDDGEFIASITRDTPSWSFQSINKPNATNLTIRINSVNGHGSSDVVELDFQHIFINQSMWLEYSRSSQSRSLVIYLCLVGICSCLLLLPPIRYLYKKIRKKIFLSADPSPPLTTENAHPDLIISAERWNTTENSPENIRVDEHFPLQNTLETPARDEEISIPTSEGYKTCESMKYVNIWKETTAKSKRDGRKRFYLEADV